MVAGQELEGGLRVHQHNLCAVRRLLDALDQMDQPGVLKALKVNSMVVRIDECGSLVASHLTQPVEQLVTRHRTFRKPALDLGLDVIICQQALTVLPCRPLAEAG